MFLAVTAGGSKALLWVTAEAVDSQSSVKSQGAPPNHGAASLPSTATGAAGPERRGPKAGVHNHSLPRERASYQRVFARPLQPGGYG